MRRRLLIIYLRNSSTGATGYIGGDGLYNIVNAHPDWEITALVRNPDKAAQVQSEYPKVKIVKGDLDSADIIEREVAEADIVFRACFSLILSVVAYFANLWSHRLR